MKYEIKDKDVKTLKKFFDVLINRGLINSGGINCMNELIDRINTKIVEGGKVEEEEE